MVLPEFRRSAARPMMLTSRVFVSHTSDMAQYPADRSFVQAALDAATAAGMAPVDMRHFAARDSQPAECASSRSPSECSVQ